MTRGFEKARSTYDVAVIGAGPAGCATAVAFAQRGAQVLLLEANPKAAQRFAGEWIHPEGVRILRDLGLLDGLDAGVLARGFVVFPNDGLGPIELQYGRGARGLACEHATLVAHLRRGVARTNGIDFIEGARAQSLGGGHVRWGSGNDAREARASLTVVAAGRSARKLTRRAQRDEKVSISLMAGLIVHDAHLPCEGFGHVLAGGPGPALAYRIAPSRIRICIDVPHDNRTKTKSADWIWRSFSDVLPSSLRPAVRQELSKATLSWAANTFQPRRYETESGMALVGDAAGVFHPLTAMGITMSLLDADALVTASSPGDYAKRRSAETYVPELLSNAIYQAFTRSDAGTLAIRDSIFRTWRASESQRSRTMDLLGAATTSRVDFVRAFSSVAVRAGTAAVFSNRQATTELAEWLRWPWAGVHPYPSTIRTRSVSWASPESWGEVINAGVS